MKYKVTAYGYFSDESVTVDAESGSKAKYAAYRKMQESGILSKAATFGHFITLYKAEAVKMEGGAENG